MVRRTIPILVRITRSSVDGRPVRTTCGTDQQVIRTGVDGVSDSEMLSLLCSCRLHIEVLQLNFLNIHTSYQ